MTKLCKFVQRSVPVIAGNYRRVSSETCIIKVYILYIGVSRWMPCVNTSEWSLLYLRAQIGAVSCTARKTKKILSDPPRTTRVRSMWISQFVRFIYQSRKPQSITKTSTTQVFQTHPFLIQAITPWTAELYTALWQAVYCVQILILTRFNKLNDQTFQVSLKFRSKIVGVFQQFSLPNTSATP